MKFEPDMPSGAAIVIGYDDQSVTINNLRFTDSVIFGSHVAPATWAFGGFDALTAEQTAQSILDMTPAGTELVLLGTGKRQTFPPVAARKVWQKAGLAVEVMDTAAACRTYNILLAEGRPVLAAVIIQSE